MFSNVWSENTTLFERLMEIPSIHQNYTMALTSFENKTLQEMSSLLNPILACPKVKTVHKGLANINIDIDPPQKLPQCRYL